MSLEGSMSRRRADCLVIVHLSSLDSYTDMFGRNPGFDLAEGISAAIEKATGPIFVLDQEWELKRRDSEPRRVVYAALDGIPLVERLHHDESEDEWAPAIHWLKRGLKRHGCKRPALAGLWYNDDGTGCAKHVEDKLTAAGFEVLPILDALGSEDYYDDEDYDDDDDDDDYGGRE